MQAHKLDRTVLSTGPLEKQTQKKLSSPSKIAHNQNQNLEAPFVFRVGERRDATPGPDQTAV